MSKRDRLNMKGEKVTVTIPRWILEAIDALVEEIEGSRSDVVTGLLTHCFQTETILDEVFPYDEEEEAE